MHQILSFSTVPIRPPQRGREERRTGNRKHHYGCSPMIASASRSFPSTSSATSRPGGLWPMKWCTDQYIYPHCHLFVSGEWLIKSLKSQAHEMHEMVLNERTFMHRYTDLQKEKTDKALNWDVWYKIKRSGDLVYEGLLKWRDQLNLGNPVFLYNTILDELNKHAIDSM